jgi:hypothetical protein
MKWFDKWFYRKARWCWHRAGQQYPELKAEQDCLDEMSDRSQDGKIACWSKDSLIEVNSDVTKNTVDMENSIRFNVLPCTGGLVLEVNIFDRKSHENTTKTYLIPDGEPIAERIGQYVTMEMMQR